MNHTSPPPDRTNSWAAREAAQKERAAVIADLLQNPDKISTQMIVDTTVASLLYSDQNAAEIERALLNAFLTARPDYASVAIEAASRLKDSPNRGLREAFLATLKVIAARCPKAVLEALGTGSLILDSERRNSVETLINDRRRGHLKPLPGLKPEA